MNLEERMLSAVLRGDHTHWPGDTAPEAFLHAVARHGIQPLVARQIRHGILLDTPSGVRESLARGAVQHAAVEQRFAAEARRVVEALARAGVPSLLMKGAALAYSHYPHPCLRPRTDTDLLVRRGDVEPAAGVFEELDYEALTMTRGDLLLHQLSYARTDRLGIRHVFDLHWKVAAPHAVSDVVSWEELDRAARPLAALGEQARAPGDAHALLLACVHRMAHHYDNRRLIWLYDIHLLASGLGEEALRAFMQQVAGRGVAPLCAHSLLLAHERFGTPLPREIEESPARASDDAPAGFHRGVRMIDILASDLRALPGWRQRLRLLREHLFPPAEYIRRRYGVSNPFLLPALYTHRCLAGALKWLRPAGAAEDPFA